MTRHGHGTVDTVVATLYHSSPFTAKWWTGCLQLVSAKGVSRANAARGTKGGYWWPLR